MDNTTLLVKAIRQGQGWTAKELASYLGVTARTIYAYEAGECRPGGSAMEMIKKLVIKKGVKR